MEGVSKSRYLALVEEGDLLPDASERRLYRIVDMFKSRLNPAVQNAFQEADPVIWRQMLGFRDVLVHDYLTLDYDMIWHILTVELALLEELVIDITEHAPEGEFQDTDPG